MGKFKESQIQGSKFDPMEFESINPPHEKSSHGTITALSWNDKKDKLLSAGKLNSKNHGNGYQLWDINRQSDSRPISIPDPFQDSSQEVKSAIWVNADEFCISVSGKRNKLEFKNFEILRKKKV